MDILMRVADALLIVLGFFLGRMSKGIATPSIPSLKLPEEIGEPISPYVEGKKTRRG